LCCARAFDAAQLIDTAPRGRLFAEAQRIHLAHHLQAQAAAGIELALDLVQPFSLAHGVDPVARCGSNHVILNLLKSCLMKV
jgi:hypothetical protein